MVVQIAPAEQRIVLSNVSWETYERILADHADSSAPRFVYDRGMLEIMTLSPEHEHLNWTLAALAQAIAEALEVEFDNLGSTTYRREDLERGLEPDSCFYLANEAAVRGKDRIDLLVDPPPDLVIEIDITHPTIDKIAIYAEFGVPEIWRYASPDIEILALAGEGYARREGSNVLPGVTVEALSQFIAESKTSGRLAWLRQVRAWAATLPR